MTTGCEGKLALEVFVFPTQFLCVILPQFVPAARVILFYPPNSTIPFRIRRKMKRTCWTWPSG